MGFVAFFSKAELWLRESTTLLRGALLRRYLRLHGCPVGKGLKCKRWPLFHRPPHGNIEVGDGVCFGYGVSLWVADNARLFLGDYVHLTHNVVISAHESVLVGAHTQVAENVSIRDSDHEARAGCLISQQGFVSAPVAIGEDVWIGASTTVLKGAQIAQGAVIGANSIVLAKSNTEPFGIYAGSPIRQVGRRPR